MLLLQDSELLVVVNTIVRENQTSGILEGIEVNTDALLANVCRRLNEDNNFERTYHQLKTNNIKNQVKEGWEAGSTVGFIAGAAKGLLNSKEAVQKAIKLNETVEKIQKLNSWGTFFKNAAYEGAKASFWTGLVSAGIGYVLASDLNETNLREQQRELARFVIMDELNGLIRSRLAEQPRRVQELNQPQTNSDVNDVFYCSITQEVMIEPVLAPDGHSYERSALQQWYDVCVNQELEPTCPNTRINLPDPSTLPINYALRNLIRRTAEDTAQSIRVTNSLQTLFGRSQTSSQHSISNDSNRTISTQENYLQDMSSLNM